MIELPDGPSGVVDSTASTADLTLGVKGIPTVVLKVVQSHARVGCDSVLGTTTIAYLKIGTKVVIATPRTFTSAYTLNVGVVSVTLDDQVFRPNLDGYSLTVNAVHIRANALNVAKADVVVASSTAGVDGCTPILD